MDDVKTWRTKPRQLVGPQQGSTARTVLIAGPGSSIDPPRPRGDLRGASVAQVVAAAQASPDDWANADSSRCVALEGLLCHLDQFEGGDWQQRWQASGLDQPGRPVATLEPPTRSGRTVHRALEALLCLRVITPSVAALRSNRVSTFAETFRRVHEDPRLDAFFAQVAQTGAGIVYQRRALFDVCGTLATQDISINDLTAEAFLHYAQQCRDLTGVANASSTRFCGHLAWDVLHEMEHFAPRSPRTLREALRGRQLTVTELVDRHPVGNDDVREMLIDYLHRRRSTLTYGSLLRMSVQLVGNFWCAVQVINPSQPNLILADGTYQQWRAGIRSNPDGSDRLDQDGIITAVRALYYDVQAWATEQPEQWARWVAPCPIRGLDVRGRMARQRRASERVADRTRVRQPLLTDLVEHIENNHAQLVRLLTAATAAGPDELIHVDGHSYRRCHTEHDARNTLHQQQPSVRVRHHDTAEELNLTRLEHSAFWEWAMVLTLRHTGVRVEELLELSQLSIRQYQRPKGEVVALLVIAPSKSNRERVVPMSAELFHVIAAIIRRHTGNRPTVPLLTRFDTNDKLTSPPQPFLFQRPRGARREVFSTTAVRDMLRHACQRLALQRPEFTDISFAPHDFRRLFATEVVNNGLPIHIGAALLGHLDLATTRGYVTIFDEDVIRHYQLHLTRRRRQRPEHEYPDVTTDEWTEFEQHFDQRKVELGNCARPYGTPCAHEHACIRCPMLHTDPRMLPRLDEIEIDLNTRRERARNEGWSGEIEGIDLTLTLLNNKRDHARRHLSNAVTISLSQTRQQLSTADETSPRNARGLASP